jgi:hypothetical protein
MVIWVSIKLERWIWMFEPVLLDMDRDLYQLMLVNLVLLDIKRKILVNNNIILQHYDAKSHLRKDDEVSKAKVTELVGDPNAVKLYIHTKPPHNKSV